MVRLAQCVHRVLQMMLLSDGSVTRHLQLLTGQPIQVVSGTRAPNLVQQSVLPGQACSAAWPEGGSRCAWFCRLAVMQPGLQGRQRLVAFGQCSSASV